MKLSSQPKLTSNIETKKSHGILPGIIRAQILAAALLASGCSMADRIGITMCRQGHSLKDEIALEQYRKKFCEDPKAKIYQKNGDTCLKCDSKEGVRPQDLR